MSEFKTIKAVRYKPTEKNLEKLGIKNIKCLKDIENKLPKLFDSQVKLNAQKSNLPYFSIDSAYNKQQQKRIYYIDYILKDSYNDYSERCRVRNLNPNELSKYKKIFSQILDEADLYYLNFRLVKYCYCEDCDVPDCFDLTDDPFYNEV